MKCISIAVIVLAAAPAYASKPVKSTLEGCVDGGAFYDTKNSVAYRIGTPAGLDLKPLEGKAVSMTGWLYPGDRFELEKDTAPKVTAPTCPADRLRLIRREQVLRVRVDATKAADAGDFPRAETLIAQAFALVTPADCDTYTDRATILAKKGDTAGAGKDIAAIKAKKCVLDKGKTMNPLLLQDLGNALLAKGDKRGAVDAFQLGLANCDGDWCKTDLEKALAAAK